MINPDLDLELGGLAKDELTLLDYYAANVRLDEITWDGVKSITPKNICYWCGITDEERVKNGAKYWFMYIARRKYGYAKAMLEERKRILREVYKNESKTTETENT